MSCPACQDEVQQARVGEVHQQDSQSASPAILYRCTSCGRLYVVTNDVMRQGTTDLR